MKWLVLIVAAGCGHVENATVDAAMGSDAVVVAPSFTVAVEPVMTELYATAPVTVTLTGHAGFAGTVALTGALTTPNGDPITDWTLALDSSVTVEDGTGIAHGTIATKSTSIASLANTLTITAGSVIATTTVTALNQVTFPVTSDNNICVYPASGGNLANPVHIRVGTKVRFFNAGAAGDGSIVIHSNGAADGIDHQGQGGAANLPPTTPPGSAYEQTLTGTSTPMFSWYCHNGNDLGTADPEIAAEP